MSGAGKLSLHLCSALRVSSVLQALRVGRDSHTQTSFSSPPAVAQGGRTPRLLECGVVSTSQPDDSWEPPHSGGGAAEGAMERPTG